MKLRFAALQCSAWIAVLSLAAHAAEPDAASFFETKIRPLFIEHCQRCHGEKKQENGLRLDSKSGWQKGGEHGAAIIPGDTTRSLLLKAVRREDKDLQMPPKHPLGAKEIATLEQWIAQGAFDPRDGKPALAVGLDIDAGRKAWAFQPIGNPLPPVSSLDHWSRNAVDRFVFERLQTAGLQPSTEADRRTLIRRATFDLTGLPPTFAEVEAFMNDSSPNAFAKVVDRLLASPLYGEQWARHWLDVARYSDTKGYVYAREEKGFVGASAYRDWVVRALNEDRPYDQFLRLQLAADQLVPEHSADLAAMGFLTLGRRFLGVTHDIIDDRIDVVMRTTQALTVACARCHDHKFDPIPTRDYYALYGVFQSCAERLVPCSTTTGVNATFDSELKARETKLRDTLAKRREEQSARIRATVTEHLVAQLELEKYPEETFTQIISAKDINPVFVRRWQNYLTAASKGQNRIFRAWTEYSKLAPEDFAALKVNATTKLLAMSPSALHPRVAKAFATPPASMREVASRYGALLLEVEKQWQAQLKQQPTALHFPDPDDEALRLVLYGSGSPCYVPDEHLANNEWFFPTDVVTELWKLQGEVDRWLIRSAEAPAYATILVDREKPSTPRIFKRGNPLTKGEEVPRQFLQVLSSGSAPAFTKGSGRLELAQAIASPRNPLTARVMVNRVWMQHFGRGLVATTSDFGKRAEPPSHPELLDFLAHDFMANGWSLKALHRHLMLSATYQQSSLGPSTVDALHLAEEHDPENRLLWRMNTHRLSFEEMRDAWLATGGELDLRVGGKPAELFAGSNQRRTLYGFIDRERLPSLLRTFDFANPDLTIPQRNDTIVPQQALFGMNHPFVAARAKALIRALDQPSARDDVERLHHLYERLYQRKPTPEEAAAAVAFLKAESTSPTAPLATALTPWQQLAQVLLLANEFVFLD